jgi:hypothetical protein
MKIIIHIGPHKPGSTYIQKNFYESREVFKKTNTCYPEEGIGPQWGHHKLVEAIIKRDENFINIFFESINDYSKIIISSENFWNLSSDDLAFFNNFLHDFSIEILFFKRNFMGLLLSSWQENVKHGDVKSWSESLLHHVLRPFESPILHCTKTLKDWDNIINPERINILNYDHIVENNGDIFQETLTICGLHACAQDKKSVELVNKSLDFSSVELIRNLNIALKKRNISVNHNVRELYLKVKNSSRNIKYIENFINNNSVNTNFHKSWGCETFERLFLEFFPEVDKIVVSPTKEVLHRMPDSNFMLDEVCYNKFVKLVDEFERQLSSAN